MSRDARIRMLTLLVTAGFLIAVGYCYLASVYLDWRYPDNTFLFRPFDRFNDFRNLYEIVNNSSNATSLDRFRQGPFQFTNLVVGAFGFFTLSKYTATVVFLATWSVALLVATYRFVRTPSRSATLRNAIILTFMTYPYLIAFDRANVEPIVLLAELLFCWAFCHGRHRLATVSLAFAVAVKPFPILFLALYLKPRRLRYLFATGGLALLFTYVALLIRVGGLRGVAWSFGNDYQQTYAIGNEGLFFGHSLWGLGKIITIWYHHITGTPLPREYFEHMLQGLTRPYIALAAILFCIVAWHVIFRESSFWKKLALIVCCENLLPFVSGDYKLLHLYLPMFFFIGSARTDRLDALYAIIFGLLMIPKAYGHFVSVPEASTEVITNPLLMIALSVIIMVSSWAKRSKHSVADSRSWSSEGQRNQIELAPAVAD